MYARNKTFIYKTLPDNDNLLMMNIHFGHLDVLSNFIEVHEFAIEIFVTVIKY